MDALKTAPYIDNGWNDQKDPTYNMTTKHISDISKSILETVSAKGGTAKMPKETFYPDQLLVEEKSRDDSKDIELNRQLLDSIYGPISKTDE